MYWGVECDRGRVSGLGLLRCANPRDSSTTGQRRDRATCIAGGNTQFDTIANANRATYPERNSRGGEIVVCWGLGFGSGTHTRDPNR